jgi:hypothetical protein
MQKQVIRVVYRTDGGRISLRTEENWDSSIEAHSIQQEGCISEFQIETERAIFLFQTGSAPRWHHDVVARGKFPSRCDFGRALGNPPLLS